MVAGSSVLGEHMDGTPLEEPPKNLAEVVLETLGAPMWCEGESKICSRQVDRKAIGKTAAAKRWGNA
jgi:hypothetical protein